jgi:3-deoxy-D-manno-octulosonic acid (KDO) 8-phosphate synthase
MARLKRLTLYALLDITQSDYERAVACPPHISVLACRLSRKKDLLSALNNTCANVFTRYSQVMKPETDKELKWLLKMDFRTQGMLTVINRTNTFTRATVFC